MNQDTKCLPPPDSKDALDCVCLSLIYSWREYLDTGHLAICHPTDEDEQRRQICNVLCVCVVCVCVCVCQGSEVRIEKKGFSNRTTK